MFVTMYFYKRLITSFIVHQPIFGNYCYPNARQIRNFAFRSKLLNCCEHKNCSYIQSRSFRLVPKNPKINGTKFFTVFKFNSTLTQKTNLGFKNNIHSTLAPRPKTSEVRRILRLAHPEKWTLTGAICLLLISSTVTMAVPFCLGRVIDIIYTTDKAQTRENLNKISLLLVGVFLVGSVCNFGRVYLMTIAGHRITQTLRQKVFKSIVSQDVAFFDKNKTGELVNRLSADTALVSQSVTMNISDGLRSTVMAAAGVSMMFYMSPELAFVGLAVVPPVAGLAIIYGKFVRKISKSVQDSLASATQVAEERIGNIRTVKSFSREILECENYNEKLKKVLELAYKESLAKGIFFGMTGLSGNAIILSVLYYGGIMVGQETLSVGQLSAFLLYAAYTGISLGGLSSFYSELSKGLGASTRLWELIDRKPVIPVSGGLTLNEVPTGIIRFEDVHFSYPTRNDNPPILNGLNLELSPGKVTAIVGSSGSGKSTIVSLLLRLYDPNKGRITLDGEDVKSLDPHWLRSLVGTVSQEPVLFSCSIKDNILYGANVSSLVTSNEVQSAAQEANALDFIQRQLPQGFDTLVGERGVMLSGGQKQRVAIARALIKDPRILVLDEATSALDAESEHLVQEAMEKVMKGRTVLVIAHRLSTIKNADQIVVLDGGQVREKGTYDELLALENGVFRKLIQHQTFVNENS